MDYYTADDFDSELLELLAEEEELQQVLIVHLTSQSKYKHTSNQKGSKNGRLKSHNRNFQLGYNSIVRDYLCLNPVYSKSMFERRFRISYNVFNKVLSSVVETNAFFQQRSDAVGKIGAYPEQKVTAALRMLAYGVGADSQDEYCRLSDSTVQKSFKEFCKSIVSAFSDQYLRSPTNSDMNRIMSFNQKRGLPGLFGSIDCMHWTWKNCPKAWKGHYQGKSKQPTIILEAIASADRWIWHAHFGVAGSNNDLNVLDRSPLVTDIIANKFPSYTYKIHNQSRTTPYFFVDGIYPKWGIFVAAYKEPTSECEKLFTKVQESVRKEVECTFGILQQRFAVLSSPCRLWFHSDMKYVILCCIILHNMMVEDRGYLIRPNDMDTLEFSETMTNNNANNHTEHTQVNNNSSIQRSCLTESILDFACKLKQLQDPVSSNLLRKNLAAHYWNYHGSNT